MHLSGLFYCLSMMKRFYRAQRLRGFRVQWYHVKVLLRHNALINNGTRGAAPNAGNSSLNIQVHLKLYFICVWQ